MSRSSTPTISMRPCRFRRFCASTATRSPVRKAALRKRDVASLRRIPFLVHDFKGQQDLTESPLLCKQKTIDNVQSIDLDLPDVAPQMIDIAMPASEIA